MRLKLIFILVCVAVTLVSKLLLAVLRKRRTSQQPGALVPPEARAKRALCLAALVVRGDMETLLAMSRAITGVDLSAKGSPRDLNEAGSERFNRWLRDEGLWDSLSPKEHRLLAADSGKWSPQDAINASWRREAAGVIAWSAGLLPSLPAWDVPFDEKSLPKAIGFQVPLVNTLQRLAPRSEGEIRRTRDTAELWLWRARTTQLIKDKPDTPLPAGMTFGKIIRLTAEKGKEEELFEPIGGDFPAFGKAYHDLSDEEWRTMNSIATERLYALNWLCGYSANWDSVRCST